MEREVARAFGTAAPALTAAVERLDALGRIAEPLLATAMTLPPNGFWERREVGRLESLLPRAGTDPLAPLGADHPFRAIAAAPAALSIGLAPSGVGSVAEARAFTLARRGLHLLDGGLGALQELLLQRIETFGGERRRRLEPIGVVVRRGRAVGLQVSPRDETIGCQWLVWAGPSAALRTTLGAAAPPASTRGRAAALRLTGYRYALSLLVGAQALPAGTPARVLAIGDPARPLVEDNALAITVGRPQPREPDRIPLWVECAVPAHLVDAGPSYLRALRGRLVQTLERLWPDFGKQIFVIASPYDGLGAERGAAGNAHTKTNAKTGAHGVAVAAAAALCAGGHGAVRHRRPAARDRDEEPAAGRAREPPGPGPRGRAGLGLGGRAPDRPRARAAGSAAPADAARSLTAQRVRRAGSSRRSAARARGASAMKRTPVRRNDPELASLTTSAARRDLVVRSGKRERQRQLGAGQGRRCHAGA